MSLKTFTTIVSTITPKNINNYCADYSRIYGAASQLCLELSLNDGGLSKSKLNTELQQKFGINKRQANSVVAEIDGKISSAKECRKLHIKNIKGQLKSVNKYLKTWEKRIKDYKKAKKAKKFKQSHIKDACSIRYNPCRMTELQVAKQRINQKKRRKYVLEQKLEYLKNKPLEVNLGNVGSQFTFVGSKGETSGNQICQLDTDGNLKIRVPRCLESEYGSYITIPEVTFKYGQQHIEAALTIGQALTYRFYYKDFSWYCAISTDVPEVPTQSKFGKGAIGIDLNPSVIGWTYVDAEGNLKDSGQFKINLHSRNTGQVEAVLADIAAQVVLLAETYECPVVIEDLDFSAKKEQLKERGKRYARMLNGFAFSKWEEVLQRRCFNRGIDLIKVNPAYTSIQGLTKYMGMYGLSSDTAAALVVARRGIRTKSFKRFSERLPRKYIQIIPSNQAYLGGTRKHSWSHWNELRRELSPSSRHNYFTSVNSAPVVNLHRSESGGQCPV
ncbi:MAG: IS200/IS605 family accessory protein TnpB-related protein [Calothrix sp. MO_192.B10]|nr:IS200/IS605 family accessory protein TnpB-related protein [Calothrix sp. MO_192.B10]